MGAARKTPEVGSRRENAVRLPDARSAGTVDNVDGSAWTLHLRSAAASLINGSTVGNARAECAGEG
jgi:hypothetical protein